MRPVLFPDYLVKLVIPASRAILKPAVIYRCVSLTISHNFPIVYSEITYLYLICLSVCHYFIQCQEVGLITIDFL